MFCGGVAQGLRYPLVGCIIYGKVSLYQHICTQLEPNIVAIDDEDQVIVLALGKARQVFKDLVDLCNVLDVCVIVFLGRPIDKSRFGVIEDGGREKELAEVSVAASGRYEEV